MADDRTKLGKIDNVNANFCFATLKLSHITCEFGITFQQQNKKNYNKNTTWNESRVNELRLYYKIMKMNHWAGLKCLRIWCVYLSVLSLFIVYYSRPLFVQWIIVSHTYDSYGTNFVSIARLLSIDLHRLSQKYNKNRLRYHSKLSLHTIRSMKKTLFLYIPILLIFISMSSRV